MGTVNTAERRRTMRGAAPFCVEVRRSSSNHGMRSERRRSCVFSCIRDRAIEKAEKSAEL